MGKSIYVGKSLEMVDWFKYLGVNFNFNCNFSKLKNDLRNQDVRVMYSIISKARSLGQPVDLQLELFDRMLLPVLTCAGGVWGVGNNDTVEKSSSRVLQVYIGSK